MTRVDVGGWERCCASFHVDVDQLEAVIEDEKRRGLWRAVTVTQAITTTINARQSGPCPCRQPHRWPDHGIRRGDR